MEQRRGRDKPGEWEVVRRGWCLGDEEFRQELLAQMEPQLGAHHGGEERSEAAEAKAAKLLNQELKRRGWGKRELAGRKKSDAGKVKIAQRVRSETTMSLGWIARELRMGVPGYVANCLRAAAK